MPGTEAPSRSRRKTGDEPARAILGCGLMIPAMEEVAKFEDPVDRAEGRRRWCYDEVGQAKLC